MGKDTVGPPPQKTVEDYEHSVSKLLLSLVPIAGGSISEVFIMAFTPPYERRLHEWLTKLAERFDELASTVNADSAEKLIESLKENDLFLSILAKAIRSVRQEHHEEKLSAIRNAVINTAAGISMEDDIQLMFLSILEDLTLTHISVLQFIKDPEKYAEGIKLELTPEQIDSIATVKTFPPWRDLQAIEHLRRALLKFVTDNYLLEHLINDLHRFGLISADANLLFRSMGNRSQVDDELLTAFGSRFLEYINAPSCEVGME